MLAKTAYMKEKPLQLEWHTAGYEVVRLSPVAKS